MGRNRPAAAGRLVLALTAVATGVLIALIAQIGPAYGRTRRTSRAVQLGSRIVLRSMDIRVLRRGVVRDGPALVVANRVCWIDILAIAASAPVVPVANCEVARWPVIGGLARRAGTVFVQRRACRELQDSIGRIAALLRQGHRVLIFPEGTAIPDGPPATFGRAGFQAAVDAAVVVQPMAVQYLDRHGRPIAAAALAGEHGLPAAIWRVLRSGPVVVGLRWTTMPAIDDGGHRAGHRARAAARAGISINRHLTLTTDGGSAGSAGLAGQCDQHVSGGSALPCRSESGVRAQRGAQRPADRPQPVRPGLDVVT